VNATILIPDNAPPFGDDDFDPAILEQSRFTGRVHVVQPLETVDQLAAFYNFDTQCLLQSNQIRNARHILPGTVLIIDETCGPYIGAGRPSLGAVTSPANRPQAETSSEPEASTGDSMPAPEQTESPSESDVETEDTMAPPPETTETPSETGSG
jgi:hypothetical protein